MYDSKRRELYWPYMANEVYKKVGTCHECAIKRDGLKRKHHLKLLPASGPLEFVAMNILGPLAKETSGKQFIFVITN